MAYTKRPLDLCHDVLIPLLQVLVIVPLLYLLLVLVFAL